MDTSVIPATTANFEGGPRRPILTRDAEDAETDEAGFPGIDFRPASIARRQLAAWRGVTGELVRTVRRETFEIEHCGPRHLLIAYEWAQREDGETTVEGVSRSTLRDLTRKMVFVPAGSRFREWQDPRALMRAIYLHLNPESTLMRRDEGTSRVISAPRLFFENPVLWQTVIKLKGLIEAGPSASRLYAEALTLVLSHELLDSECRSPVLRARGGLARWQRRAVIQHIEESLTEEISLATLATVADLSPYHFSRAFKESFGVPPHRYHIGRRIERAKTLLADRKLSLLQIAIKLGFGQSSSFSIAFRKIAGQTPSAYRRSLF